MEFRELDGPSFVSLTNWKWHEDSYSVRATITAQSYGFAGSYDEIWFFWKELAAFVQALRQFTRKHEGEARLESIDPRPDMVSVHQLEDMDPREAMVSVRRLDAAAHVLVEARVTHWLFRRDRLLLNNVSVAFELDHSQLQATVEALTAVLAEREPPQVGLKLF